MLIHQPNLRLNIMKVLNIMNTRKDGGVLHFGKRHKGRDAAGNGGEKRISLQTFKV